MQADDRTAKLRATLNAKNAAARLDALRLVGRPPQTKEFAPHLENFKQLRSKELEKRKKKPRGKPFPKGVSGNPSGLPKEGNVAHAKRLSVRKQLLEDRRKVIAQSGLTPLEFLLSVVRDPWAHTDYRILAARSAAPYCHQKMPIAIEGGDPSKPIVFEASSLAMLQPQEKILLLGLIEKMTLAMQPKTPKAYIESVATREAESDDHDLPDSPEP